jgi:hypothetical protein
MEIYENKTLEDLSGEVWVSAYGGDGTHEVSNLGRLKSIQRIVTTITGIQRNKPERICNQSSIKKNNRIVGLMVFIKETKHTGKLVWQSFNPNTNILKNECIMHINKILVDNRIVNLKKVTRVKSRSVDMIKSPLSVIATYDNLEKANSKNLEFFNNRTHKTCVRCGHIDLKENFPDNKLVCKSCLNIEMKDKRKNFIYIKGKRVCNTCNVEKLNKDFPKMDNTCKTCRYKIHREYQDIQRETLGDWYVKEYGKFNYNHKEFDQALIDKLRTEIVEKRKPRHIYDGLEFKTSRDFARYVFKTYKIPITTVEKRLSDNYSEYVCTLTRKQFINTIKKTYK